MKVSIKDNFLRDATKPYAKIVFMVEMEGYELYLLDGMAKGSEPPEKIIERLIGEGIALSPYSDCTVPE
jgi:hypothetical protein